MTPLQQFIDDSQADIDDCRNADGDTHVFKTRLGIALQHLRDVVAERDRLAARVAELEWRVLNPMDGIGFNGPNIIVCECRFCGSQLKVAKDEYQRQSTRPKETTDGK